MGAAAAHATSVEHAEIAEREDENDHADGEADIAVGDGEVWIVTAGEAVDKQRHDADEGGEEERRKTCSEAHQQRRKPAEIPEWNAEKNALAAGAGYIMKTIHLK